MQILVVIGLFFGKRVKLLKYFFEWTAVLPPSTRKNILVISRVFQNGPIIAVIPRIGIANSYLFLLLQNWFTFNFVPVTYLFVYCCVSFSRSIFFVTLYILFILICLYVISVQTLFPAVLTVVDCWVLTMDIVEFSRWTLLPWMSFSYFNVAWMESGTLLNNRTYSNYFNTNKNQCKL